MYYPHVLLDSWSFSQPLGSMSIHDALLIALLAHRRSLRESAVVVRHTPSGFKPFVFNRYHICCPEFLLLKPGTFSDIFGGTETRCVEFPCLCTRHATASDQIGQGILLFIEVQLIQIVIADSTMVYYADVKGDTSPSCIGQGCQSFGGTYFTYWQIIEWDFECLSQICHKQEI